MDLTHPRMACITYTGFPTNFQRKIFIFDVSSIPAAHPIFIFSLGFLLAKSEFSDGNPGQLVKVHVLALQISFFSPKIMKIRKI